MSSDDNKSDYPGATLDKTESIKEGFNHDSYFEQQLAKLQPEAQKACREVQQAANHNIEKFKQYQSQYKQRNIDTERAKLLEKYIQDNALRPDSAKQNPEQDIKIIEEQAEKNVELRMKWQLENQEKASNATVRSYVSMKLKEHEQGNRDIEHER